MGLSHAMSLHERKELLKDNRFAGGFRNGLAASLLNRDTNFVNNNLAERHGDIYSEIFLGAEKGELANEHNSGLVAGYLYGQSLSSEERDELREVGTKDINVGVRDYVLYVGANLGETVTQVFDDAAKEAAENEAKRVRQIFENIEPEPSRHFGSNEFIF